MYISPRFRRNVESHIIMNSMKAPVPGTPLILAIHGAPGTGKTYQLDRVLDEGGVIQESIDASEFESAQAGRPSDNIRDRYLTLSHKVARDGYYAGVLVINDIDSAIGDWGELVQTTINLQQVYGMLQKISDFPEHVGATRNHRIPIIVTANDLSKLYAPLLRPGRMSRFHWIPDRTEIIEMIRPVFPHFRDSELQNLVDTVESFTISEYVNAVRLHAENSISATGGTFSDTLLKARRGTLQIHTRPSPEDVVAAFHQLRTEQGKTVDYSRPHPTRPTGNNARKEL